MTDTLSKGETPDQTIERILTKGDISGLPLAERNSFLVALAKHYGLDPAGRPFDLIPLPDGRMIPYANKNAAEQLRKVHNISIEVISRGISDISPDVYTVTARASMPTPDGPRINDEIGAVFIRGKVGEDLSNIIMRCSTKASRRATFAICGLGMLDESEVATIPNIKLGATDKEPRRIMPGPSPFNTSLPGEVVIQSLPVAGVSDEPIEAATPIPRGVKPYVAPRAIPKASAAPTRHPPAVPPFKVGVGKAIKREEK